MHCTLCQKLNIFHNEITKLKPLIELQTEVIANNKFEFVQSFSDQVKTYSLVWYDSAQLNESRMKGPQGC